MTTFLEEARQETAKLRQAIHDLPFNLELTAGTLRQDRFQHYLIQDALYLTEYARALAALAAKAPSAGTIAQFGEAAAGAVFFEQAMQQTFLTTFGITAAEVAASSASPTNLAYTGFMLAEGMKGTYETLLAAVLPCFSIYAEVGAAIAAKASDNNPFQLWIDTYAAPEFQQSVQRAEEAANRIAQDTNPALYRKMLNLFRCSVEFEWMFWDAAYRLETWPTAIYR
ncbi:thiaminase II [Dongia soli]|uniref:Aminopyrimidine aminohydrolase n=1 Tax=Dongia soli TaxID=600628 RepID=A0ABU5E9P0_9PROT|nr:thiaminase II [Dongia soli]MDY0882690.1 thiaminase II [Dongia soli]